MEESAFEIDAAALAEASMLFPAHRLAPPVPRPAGDVSYLSAGAPFVRHAWDEGGRP